MLRSGPSPHRRAAREAERAPARAGGWLLLFAVALVLRAGYACVAGGPGTVPSSDPAEYDTVAWNLARGAGFSLDTASRQPYPTAFVPPVVPWIVSLLYRIVGHDYFAAVLLQCVIGAFVPLLTAALAAAMFGGTIGVTAGVLVAFDPLLVFFSGYLLTETVFCATLLLALLSTAEWIKTPRPGRALGAGLLWGIAALTRPTALLLPVILAAWAWVPLGLTVAPRDRVRQVLLLLLGVALVVGPWTARNAAVLGAFIPIKSGSGRALLDGNNALAWSDPALRGGAVGTFDREPWASQLAGLSGPQVDARATRLALDFLLPRAREWPAMALAKLARMWRFTAEGGATGSWQREGSPLAVLARWVDPLLLWFAATVPLALWGVTRTLRGPRRWFQSMPALVVVYFSAVTIVFWGALRMRVPVEPVVLLFAAVGIEDLRRRIRARTRGFTVIEGARTAD